MELGATRQLSITQRIGWFPAQAGARSSEFPLQLRGDGGPGVAEDLERDVFGTELMGSMSDGEP